MFLGGLAIEIPPFLPLVVLRYPVFDRNETIFVK
jgi:hypothetical protein